MLGRVNHSSVAGGALWSLQYSTYLYLECSESIEKVVSDPAREMQRFSAKCAEPSLLPPWSGAVTAKL